MQEGQRSLGDCPTLERKELRAEQYPDRSWDRVDLKGRGRESSSSEMGGGGVRRTLLGLREDMAFRTAVVWSAWRVGLYSLGGRTPFERYGETEGRNLDWRVWRMCRGPDGAVVIAWDGCVGIRVRAKN